MKNSNLVLFTAFVFLIFLFTGCLNLQQGSGNIVKEERNLSGFSAVDAQNSVLVFLSQGEPASVVVEVDDNLQDRVSTSVSGGVLYLSVDYTGFAVPQRQPKIYVSLPEIVSLSADNSASISLADGVSAEVLSLSAQNAGIIDGRVHVMNLSVSVQNAAKITLSGEAVHSSFSAQNAASIDAYGLSSNNTYAVAQNAASIKTTTTGSLRAEAMNAGSVSCNGTVLEILQEDESSGGQVLCSEEPGFQA